MKEAEEKLPNFDDGNESGDVRFFSSKEMRHDVGLSNFDSQDPYKKNTSFYFERPDLRFRHLRSDKRTGLLPVSARH